MKNVRLKSGILCLNEDWIEINGNEAGSRTEVWLIADHAKVAVFYADKPAALLDVSEEAEIRQVATSVGISPNSYIFGVPDVGIPGIGGSYILRFSK